MPLLYSLLYLKAFWDPYSKLADMPVAVVNLDEGTQLDGETVKYGEGIVENLKNNQSVGWKFVSQEDADRGLEGNKYYAKFEISKDFSKKVASAKEGTPTQAGLKFVCNEKKNFLAAQVNSKVESALKAEIVQTITDNYVTASFDNLYTVKDGMSAAADGSGKINDGLKELNDKTPLLEDGVNKLNNGSNQLYNGQTSLNSGISQINGGLSSLKNGEVSINDRLGKLNNKIPLLSSGVDRLYKGTGELATGTNALYEGYTKKIYPGVSQLNSGASQLKRKLDNSKSSIKTLKASVAPLKQGGIDISNTSDTVNTGYDSLKTGINGVLLNKTLTDEQKLQAIKGALNNFETKALTPYTSGVKGYTSSASKFATGSGALVDSVNIVSGAIDSISSASVINYSVIFNDLTVLAVIMVAFLTVSIIFQKVGERMQIALEGKKDASM